MKTFVSMFSISLFLLILWQCNPMFAQEEEKTVPVSTAQRDLEKQKGILAEHLRDCSDQLDRRITSMQEQIEKFQRSDKEVKKSLQALKVRLIREKSKVDRSLKEIEESTEKSWTKVNKKAGEILTEANIEKQKIEESVENLID